MILNKTKKGMRSIMTLMMTRIRSMSGIFVNKKANPTFTLQLEKRKTKILRDLRSIAKIWTAKVTTAIKSMEFLEIAKKVILTRKRRWVFVFYQTDQVFQTMVVKIMNTLNSSHF